MTEQSEFDKKTEYYYNQIINEKPNFVGTWNSFDRRCVYTAIERINKSTDLDIKCNRRKELEKPNPDYSYCSKHREITSGTCDYERCHDPVCERKECRQCASEGIYDDEQPTIMGDELYPIKHIIGIDLYYGNDPKQKKGKFKKLYYNSE